MRALADKVLLLHTPPLPAACLHSIVHEGFHWPAAVHREIAGTERSGILIRTGQEVKGSFTDKARETSKARPLAPGCRALSPDRSGGAGMYEAGGRHFPTASQGRHHATTHTQAHTRTRTTGLEKRESLPDFVSSLRSHPPSNDIVEPCRPNLVCLCSGGISAT